MGFPRADFFSDSHKTPPAQKWALTLKLRHNLSREALDLPFCLVQGHHPLVEEPCEPVDVHVAAERIQLTLDIVTDRSGDVDTVEGSYMAKVSGDIAGTASGTMAFTGSNERGLLKDLGVGYLDSGEVAPYTAQGVYWSNKQGHWGTRAAVIMGDQMMVVEGQIKMTGDGYTTTGGVFALT